MARSLASDAACATAAAVVAALIAADAANGKEAVHELLVNQGDLLAQLLGQEGLSGQIGQRRNFDKLRHDSLSARPALPQVAQQPARSAGPRLIVVPAAGTDARTHHVAARARRARLRRRLRRRRTTIRPRDPSGWGPNAPVALSWQPTHIQTQQCPFIGWPPLKRRRRRGSRPATPIHRPRRARTSSPRRCYLG